MHILNSTTIEEAAVPITAKQCMMPFFNRSNNEDLILAIQTAEVSRGRNGFKKDRPESLDVRILEQTYIK